MNVTTEDKRQEAVMRMKALGASTEAIKRFADKGYVGISESPSGQFHRAEGEDLERIRRVEAEYGALVYMVIRSSTDTGKMDSILFVNDCPEDWGKERQALMSGGPVVAYVHNFDAPDRSGVSIIGIAGTAGTGLCQTHCTLLTDIFEAMQAKAR